MGPERLTTQFILLRALRWLPIGLVLPFLILTPQARGLSLAEIGAVFAVHSAVAIVLEVPSGALADALGRRRIMLVGASLTAASLFAFALAQNVPAFMGSVALLAAGRALISGSLEAWYVDALRLLDPGAPLARGLSRGTAAEAIAMACGSLAAGGVVAATSGAGNPDAVFSGYGLAAVVASAMALVYLVAVATLVHERPASPDADAAQAIGRRTREIIRVARAEARASVTVRVIFVTGIAWGASLTAVELLWQPQLAELLGGAGSGEFAFGALAAAAMVAVAIGAGASPSVGRRLGLRVGYLVGLAFAALCIAFTGAPDMPLLFAGLYLLTYLGLGIAEPIHYELLNEAVGSKARATVISAESLGAQGGALVANLGVGALAAAQGAGLTFAVSGALLALATGLVATRLLRDRRPRSNAVDQAGHQG